MPQDLSLNDVVMPKCYTRALWIFDYKIDDLEKAFIEFLKQFCPSAFDRIVYDAAKPNYGQLIESTSGPNNVFSRADQLDQSVTQYINCSFQEMDFFPYTALPTDTSPLVFLHQINLCDGTLLAFGMHHHFTDGYGFFTLIDRFSKWFVQKGDCQIPKFNFNRALLQPGSEIRYDHIEYTMIPPTFSFTSIPTMEVLVKKYTKQDLFTKLNITTANLSLNDVVVAWLTQAISRIRQIPSTETVNVGMASDGRRELGLGADYFGNCNFFVCFQFPMHDLLTKSVNELAERINTEKKQRMTKDYMISALAMVQNATNAIHPGFQSFLGKDLAFTNWSRFPLYQVDFGHGPPRRVTLPNARWDGLVLIFPSQTNEIELYIGLKQDHADQLRQELQ
ncbi:unnamed protein product [Adineta ricciae]|uniref:Uncharacterized protein n=1 Tax=Adineta ricciae TaxID=249248 RepID=A0A816F224_ADIRI|nr:unnamed protein product [Adineta ricciae]